VVDPMVPMANDIASELLDFVATNNRGWCGPFAHDRKLISRLAPGARVRCGFAGVNVPVDIVREALHFTPAAGLRRMPDQSSRVESSIVANATFT